MCALVSFFLLLYGDNRDLYLLTHSFPTRRSSDLLELRRGVQAAPAPARWQCVGTARCLVGLTICHTSRRATWTRTPAAFRSSVSDCAAAHEHAHARAARLERRQGRGVDAARAEIGRAHV